MKKNVLVMITAVFFVLLFSWAVGVDMQQIVDGLTLVLPTIIISLAIEDFWRKIFSGEEGHKKLNLIYGFGVFITFVGVLAFLWASEAVTWAELGQRAAITFSLAVLGIVWKYWLYENSITAYDELVRRKWERDRTAILRKADTAYAFKRLGACLPYRLCDNSLLGDILFNQPFAVIDGEPKTYNQVVRMLRMKENDEELQKIRDEYEKELLVLAKQVTKEGE